MYMIERKKELEKLLKEKRRNLNKGEYIISVQCWIINNQGKILLTKRNLNKTHGGMWEPTNGLVISGEAVKRQ